MSMMCVRLAERPKFSSMLAYPPIYKELSRQKKLISRSPHTCMTVETVT